MQARVQVSRSAAALIFGEVQRWVELGLRRQGAALESLVYPLSALVPSGALRSPLELAGLSQLAALVLDGVAIPPDSVKAFSPANCHFAPADPAAANRAFNAAIDQMIEARPRLGVHSKLHSHPFSASPFLSQGDLYHGVASPAAVAWRRCRGLSTAVLHLVYPDGEPRVSGRPWRLTREGARCDAAGGRVLWSIRSWASGDDGQMQDLGTAELLPDGHPRVRLARRLPYWRRRHGARWCDGQKAGLRAAGYQVSRNLLGRGWRRYLLRAGGRHLVFALPPDLPAARPRVLQVHDAASNQFELLSLPAPGRRAQSLSGLSLLDLARHFGPPG
jgi:hypothetical protein